MRGQLVAAETTRKASGQGAQANAPQAAALTPRFDLSTVPLTHEDPVLRRSCPTGITFNFTDPLHQPLCGGLTPNAVSAPAGSTMSLTRGTVAVHAGSRIAANGDITLDAAQACGDLNARADRAITNPDGSTTSCEFAQGFRLRSHPTGVASTSNSAAGVPANQYGAVFDHVFTSNDSKVASLETVGIGERFPNIPNPTAASHKIVAPTNPFGGTFTLNTSTLTDGATDNWFATASGGLNGTQDMVFTGRAGVNVQLHAVSTSNPTPKFPLPAKMDIEQHLHWFCPQAAAGARWTDFATVHHIRTLQEDGSGGLDFVTEVNGSTQTDAYDSTSAVAVIGVTPTPTTVAPSPAGAGTKGGPPRNTVAIATTSLPAQAPSGRSYTFTIQGNALGCTIKRDAADTTAATLSIGTKTGTITVRATSTNNQFHEATVTIAAPAPSPAPPAPGTPAPPAAPGGTP